MIWRAIWTLRIGCAMDIVMTKASQPCQPDHADAAPPLKRGQSAQMQRDLRSKAALKANMARRKAQVRARDDQDTGQDTPAAGQETE